MIRQLQAGRKFGFVGSSDTHRMVPGLGGALSIMLPRAIAWRPAMASMSWRRISTSEQPAPARVAINPFAAL